MSRTVLKVFGEWWWWSFFGVSLVFTFGPRPYHKLDQAEQLSDDLAKSLLNAI